MRMADGCYSCSKEEQMLYDEGPLDVVSVDGAVGYQGGMH